MTTKEERYEADFMKTLIGKNVAIYNPNNKPLDELPKIFGFNEGRRDFHSFSGVLLSEDGTFLDKHISSSENYMLGDLGILEGTQPNKHKQFKEHYPNGYRMEFVSYDNVKNNVKLMEAIERFQVE